MKIIVLILSIVVLANIGVNFVYAIDPTPPTIPNISEDKYNKFDEKIFGNNAVDPEKITSDLIPKIFNEVLGIAGLIFLLLLLFGGFSYLLGAGNEEKTSKAKKLMVDAVIGLLITAGAYGIGTMIINFLMTGKF